MIYIKRQSTSLLLALASLSVVSSSLMSCSESMGISGVTLSDKKISFTATEVNAWTSNSNNRSNDETTRAIGSYHPLTVKNDLGKPLYLHPVEQVGTYFYNDKDELVTRSGIPLSEINNQNSISTRGSKVTEIGDEIFVSSVSKSKKDNVEAEFFPFEKATRSGSTWHTSNDEYWTTDATLSFYAYAPTNGSMLSESGSGLSKDRTVHYVAGTGDDIKSQPDFIVAKSENNSRSATDAASAVNLHFSHALTAITFSVGDDMVLGTVKSVAIRNVKGKGDYNISTGQWTLSSDLSDYEIPLGTNGNGIDIKTGVAKALTTDPLTLMMIPQKFDDNSTTEVEIVFDNGAGDRTLSAELKGTEWKAGYTINYKLSANSITTLNMGDVTFPTSWSSNINATATNKIKSAYANGDKIGLFVVDENKKVRNANIAITYNGTSWTLPNGETYKFSPQYTYFAYYPYQSSLTGLPAVNATVGVISDATAFFSNAINTWQTTKLTSDQSTLAKLSACDLQIGKATFDNTASKINFASMAHAMSLAEVTLTTRNDCNCELYNDASYTWVGPVPASENFGTNKPFKVTNYQYTNNKFVEIVKPNTETKFSGGKKEYGVWSTTVPAIKANAISSGSSVLEKKQRFTLELGDIYYSDGALTHQNEALASNKTSIGLVGYIAQGNDDYWVEKNTKADGIGGHALVIAFKYINTYGGYSVKEVEADFAANSWGGSKVNAYLGGIVHWALSNGNYQSVKTTAANIPTSKNSAIGSGYKNTVALWQNQRCPIFYKVYQYNTAQEAANNFPKKSTGWFIASAGQFYAVLTGLGGADVTLNYVSSIGKCYLTKNGSINTTASINNALAKVGDGNYSVFLSSDFIVEWSSSETDYMDAVHMSGTNDGRAYFGLTSAGKTTSYGGSRPFLAF